MIKIIWTSNNLHHDIVPFCWSAKEDHFFEANEKTLSPNKKRKPIMTYIPTLNFKNTMNQFIFHFTGFYYAWEKERKQAHLIFTLRIDDKTIQYFCCFKMHLEYSPHLLKKRRGMKRKEASRETRTETRNWKEREQEKTRDRRTCTDSRVTLQEEEDEPEGRRWRWETHRGLTGFLRKAVGRR